MAENSASALDELYDCGRQGLSIFEFGEHLQRFWLCEIAKRQYLYEIRFSKDPCKKLMDEIMPVARLIFREHPQAERDIPQGSLLILRWRKVDSNHRSPSRDCR